LFSIDFAKPWWALLAQQKLRIALVLIPQIFKRVAGTMLPIILGQLFIYQRFDYFVYVVLGWGVILVFDYFSDFNYVQLYLSTQSVQYYAHQFLLKIDPIFHATRETGKILAKIERAVRAYREVLEIGLNDLFLTTIAVITSLVALTVLDPLLGLIALGMVVALVIVAYITYVINNRAFFHHYLAAEDQLKNLGLENLAQINLIRAAFAGNEANRRLRRQTQQSMMVERGALASFYLMDFIMRTLFFSMFFVVCCYLLMLARGHIINEFAAATFAIAFFRGTYDITKVGRRVYWLITYIEQINDLYDFLRTFGYQTFPVLSEHRFELPLNKEGNIVIKASSLKFRYNVNAQIFNEHSLILTVVPTQKNKLYGIIGPSGAGKTTLLSILGGQLKPQDGIITINGINIYAIDDYARRTIIAMQNQTASTLRGSVRFNLVFGIAQDQQSYADAELQNVLERVGLWKLFADRNGLETLIGEGGLTLSGGQRQRFNFAGLYLRAKYYKPLLILMDEPTSSLDEVSELAITAMIEELAAQAVVFVIAHRLHTLEHATGLLDISLISQTKKIRFYPPEQLMTMSSYYQALLKGDIKADSV
jgi:ATP-binding cassette subfamily B protein